MNTFLRIVALIAMVIGFYTASILFDYGKKIKTGNIVYYVISTIIIIGIVIFSFPEYIFLSWNKISFLFCVLVTLCILYYFWQTVREDLKRMLHIKCEIKSKYVVNFITTYIFVFIFVSIFVMLFFSYPLENDTELFDTLEVKETYSIATTSLEDCKISVIKIEENNKKYYCFTYFDNAQKAVPVKISEDQADIILITESDDTATLEIKEKISWYRDNEMKEESDSYITLEDESFYTIHVSEKLYQE